MTSLKQHYHYIKILNVRVSYSGLSAKNYNVKYCIEDEFIKTKEIGKKSLKNTL